MTIATTPPPDKPLTATPGRVFYAYLDDTHGVLAKIEGEILFMADDGTLTVIEPEHCAFLMPLGEVGVADTQHLLDEMRGGAVRIACTRGAKWEHHMLRQGATLAA